MPCILCTSHYNDDGKTLKHLVSAGFAPYYCEQLLHSTLIPLPLPLTYATSSQDLNKAPFCGTSRLKGSLSSFANGRPVFHYSSQLTGDTDKCLHSPILTGQADMSKAFGIESDRDHPGSLFPGLCLNKYNCCRITLVTQWREIRKLLTGPFLLCMRLFRWRAWLGGCYGYWSWHTISELQNVTHSLHE